MRCRGEDCKTCRKNHLNRAKCWSKWGLCGKCAVKKYPQEYRKKIEETKVEHKYELLQNSDNIMTLEGIKIGTV